MEFDAAYDKLMGHEGVLSEDPRDPGGLTKFGISQRAYPQEDIRNLTRDRAKELTFRDYWQPMVDDWNIRPSMRFHVFDVAFNSGKKIAVLLLQRTASVPTDQQDGAWGPFTAKCLANVPDEKAVEWFNGWRLMFYTDLNTWPTFGKGWARRVARNLLEPE